MPKFPQIHTPSTSAEPILLSHDNDILDEDIKLPKLGLSDRAPWTNGNAFSDTSDWATSENLTICFTECDSDEEDSEKKSSATVKLVWRHTLGQSASSNKSRNKRQSRKPSKMQRPNLIELPSSEISSKKSAFIIGKQLTKPTSLYKPIRFAFAEAPIFNSKATNFKCSVAQALYKVDANDVKTYVKKRCPKLREAAAQYAMPHYYQKAYGFSQCKTAFNSLISRRSSHHKSPHPILNLVSTETRMDQLMRLIVCERYIGDTPVDPLREQLTAAVKKEAKVPYLLLRRPNFVSDHLQKHLEEITSNFGELKDRTLTITETDDSSHRMAFRKTLENPCDSILAELEQDLPAFRFFYKGLIQKRCEDVEIPNSVIEEVDVKKLNDTISQLENRLEETRHEVGSHSRFEAMELIAASEFNSVLLHLLVANVNGWLAQILRGLLSSYPSIREESCSAFCFLTQNFLLMRELAIHRVFDIFHDLMIFMLKSAECRPEACDEYCISICYLMHHCPSPSMLEPIIEKSCTLKKSELKRWWPRLIYYAYKYWPETALGITNEWLIQRILMKLEDAFQRSWTRKNSRAALFYFCRRANRFTKLFTIHPGRDFIRIQRSK